MMAVIEPQFQRDFISLLPKELALYVLSFLEPRDLLRAAQTCRYWRILAEDNLLWREKCKETGLNDCRELRRRSKLSAGFSYSPWKSSFMRQHNIEMNWRLVPIKTPKVLKGHDDHVITCLQFSGNRIVSGSDDNTLKVSLHSPLSCPSHLPTAGLVRHDWEMSEDAGGSHWRGLVQPDGEQHHCQRQHGPHSQGVERRERDLRAHVVRAHFHSEVYASPRNKSCLWV